MNWINKCNFGDCREVMRQMIADGVKVQTCVTSPPYWGLRDYGVDGQLGLERTPQEYVENMVEVFGLVRDLLSDDGTLWLNLGSSYSSGGRTSYDNDPKLPNREHSFRPSSSGKQPNQSRIDAPACGTYGKALHDYPVTDSSCSDLCDGCRAALSKGNDCTCQPRASAASPRSQTDRDIEPPGSASEFQDASLPGVQASTTPEFSSPPSAACSHCANCGACLAVLRSSSRDASLCARRGQYINGNVLPASAGRNQDRDVLGTAWMNYSMKPKDMIPIPWMVAMALQADGWYLRSDIIWSKPNPMPESVTDRPTRSHEYLFLLSKNERYYYDHEAIKEAAVCGWNGSSFDDERDTTLHPNIGKKPRPSAAKGSFNGKTESMADTGQNTFRHVTEKRNKRTVWTISTVPYPGSHFAVFPPALIEPCILAGSRPGDIVFDPFFGSGTTGQVAEQLGRQWIGCEIQQNYEPLQKKRTAQVGMSL